MPRPFESGVLADAERAAARGAAARVDFTGLEAPMRAATVEVNDTASDLDGALGVFVVEGSRSAARGGPGAADAGDGDGVGEVTGVAAGTAGAGAAAAAAAAFNEAGAESSTALGVPKPGPPSAASTLRYVAPCPADNAAWRTTSLR